MNSPSTLTPPPNNAFLLFFFFDFLPSLLSGAFSSDPNTTDHPRAPVAASNWLIRDSVSMTYSLPPATTGVAANRVAFDDPATRTSHACESVAPSARLPIDFEALPPG